MLNSFQGSCASDRFCMFAPCRRARAGGQPGAARRRQRAHPAGAGPGRGRRLAAGGGAAAGVSEAPPAAAGRSSSAAGGVGRSSGGTRQPVLQLSRVLSARCEVPEPLCFSPTSSDAWSIAMLQRGWCRCSRRAHAVLLTWPASLQRDQLRRRVVSSTSRSRAGLHRQRHRQDDYLGGGGTSSSTSSSRSSGAAAIRRFMPHNQQRCSSGHEHDNCMCTCLQPSAGWQVCQRSWSGRALQAVH